MTASPRQLQVFVAVALSGSVRVAAEQLHMSQPAASMALADLERALDVELFQRHRRRLSLSERGRELLPQAQEIIERLRDLTRRAKVGPGVLSGELRLGASNTVGNYMIGDLLGAFTAAHPEVRVQLTVANTAEIAHSVANFVLDIGCVEGPATHPDLVRLPWRRDRLVVCARADHPLARRKRLRPEHFAGARWILRESGSATRSVFEHAAAESLGMIEVAMELGQSEAIKQAVLAGLGISCLPQAALDASPDNQLVALRTPFLELERQLELLLHKDKYRGAVLDAFVAASVKPGSASRG